MPQMAPIYWLILFTMFMTMFYIMVNIMYFSYIKFNNNKILISKNMMKKNYNKSI